MATCKGVVKLYRTKTW